MDIEYIKKEFCKKVRLYRTQHKFTQEIFAEIVDIEQATLSNIENGKAYPTFSTVCNLIEKARIEPGYLFGFISEKSSKVVVTDKEISNLLKQIPKDAKEHIIELLKIMIK